MKMKFKNYLALIIVLIAFVNCGDDDDDGFITVEANDRGEQSITDDVLIREYLETHFYNYEAFESPEADFDFKVMIDTIAGDNIDKTPIIDSPFLTTKIYTRSEAEQTLYILTARQGNSEALPATIADSTFITYNGFTMTDDSSFDTTPNPIWFDLSTAIDGFTNGLADFKGAESEAIINPDGTVSFDGFSAGAIFIPSGLGYFNATTVGDSYSNLVFTFNVFNVVRADHDNDGIYSIDEDLDANGFLFDDADNPDDDVVFAYLDTDDDNDGVLTSLEIETDDDDNLIAFLDTDGDGLSNHLDDDDDGDGRDTLDEININATTGEITYPDSDEDGIADYLDSDS